MTSILLKSLFINRSSKVLLYLNTTDKWLL